MGKTSKSRFSLVVRCFSLCFWLLFENCFLNCLPENDSLVVLPHYSTETKRRSSDTKTTELEPKKQRSKKHNTKQKMLVMSNKEAHIQGLSWSTHGVYTCCEEALGKLTSHLWTWTLKVEIQLWKLALKVAPPTSKGSLEGWNLTSKFDSPTSKVNFESRASDISS